MLLSFVLAGMMLLSCVSPVFAASRLRGDIDVNGKVEASDARTALRYSVGLDGPSSTQRSDADIDGNGIVSAADARMILRMSVGLESLIYYNIRTDTDPAVDPKPVRESEQAKTLRSVLYDVAHANFNTEKNYGKSFNEIHAGESNRSPLELGYGLTGKWCCYYTVHDVFRVALRKAGYSEARIEELAPLYYPKKTISTAISNILSSETNDYKDIVRRWNVPSVLIPSDLPFYIPSVLLDYYQNASDDICEVYTFHVYWDDAITGTLIKRSKNLSSYEPMVGDVVFMSNKTSTYIDGYCTVDHTAQIIKVFSDGSFLCTEGGIVINDLPDQLPRVRERRYKYSNEEKTYLYINNSVVKVLACVRPKL